MDNEDKKTTKWSGIEPYCVVHYVVRNLWMVILVALLAIMGIYLFQTLLAKPSYACSTIFSVTSKFSNTAMSVSATSASTTSATEQFSQLLTNETLLDTAAKAMHLDSFPATISAVVIPDTNLIRMTVAAPTPKMAYTSTVSILNNYEFYAQYIFDTVVMEPVNLPGVPSATVSLSARRNTLIMAGPLGAAAMILGLVLLCIFSGTVQTPLGARDQVDGELLTTIRHEQRNRTLRAKLTNAKKSLLISDPTTSFYYAETIHQIRTRLEHTKHRKGHKVFLVTSVSENEGKSTVAANLALSLAKKHKKVLLVDADLRKPAQHLVFEQPVEDEMALDYLLQHPLDSELLIHALQYRKEDNLFCLFANNARRRSADLLASPQTQKLMSVLRKNFDYVIVDSPPVGYFTDSEILADLVDASVLVIRQDGVAAVAVNDVIDTLSNSRSFFLGFVLNDLHVLNAGRLLAVLGRGYGYGYGKGYGYGYGYGYGRYGYGYGYGRYGYGYGYGRQGYGYGRSGYGYGYGYGYGKRKDGSEAEVVSSEGVDIADIEEEQDERD